MQKKFIAKIYSIAGVYIKTINPDSLMGEIRFTSKTSGGQGECSLDLSLPIDDFDEGVSIKQMNFVKIYESDTTFNASPVLIYTGYISQYTPYFSEGKQGVKLTLLGLASLLSLAYYKAGGSYAIATSDDPANIFKAIIDHFNTVYSGSWIGYAGGNISNVGTSVSVAFNDQKWLDCLKKAAELGLTGRFWKIAEDGEVHFKVKPSTATHRFTLGLDVSSGEVVKNSEQIINLYQLRWGGVPTVANFSDGTSEASYGVHEFVENDSGTTDATGATQKGNKKIADSKDPKVQAKLKINTNYNIESVKPGDTCSVFNVKNGSTTFPTNMLITSVSYSPDGVDIELENERSTFADNFNAAVQAAS